MSTDRRWRVPRLMLALLAAIVWFLAAFGVGLGHVSMLLLGLALLALHFAFSIALPVPTWHRSP